MNEIIDNEKTVQLRSVKPRNKVCEIRPKEKDKEFLKSFGQTMKKVLHNEYKNALVMYFDEEGEAMWWHLNDGEYYATIGLIADNLVKYSLQQILSMMDQ